MAEQFVFWKCPECKHVEVVHESTVNITHKHNEKIVSLVFLKRGVYDEH